MRRIGSAAAIAALLSGCAVAPKDVRPQVAVVQEDALGLDRAGAAVDAQWWRAFGDPQLDRLVALGIAGNPSLESALARVRAAAAAVDVDRAALGPQVDALGTVQGLRFSDHFIGPGGWQGLGLLQATLQWNIDLFGRQKAKVRQAAATAQGAALDAEAARIALSTSIAQSYVGLAQANVQIGVAENFVRTRRNALGYVRARIANRLSNQFDLRTAETLLAEADQSKVRAVRERDLVVHALAALVGRGADFYPQIAAPTLALDKPPVVPDLIPADLLGRRPDLLAARARIDAAVAGRKVAADAYLPNVNVIALASLAAIGLGNLFTASAGQLGGGPAISLPIFHSGQLRAQYKGATADLDQAVADYDDAVLGAVRQAADAVTQVRSIDDDVAAQRRKVDGLRDTVRLDGVRVASGLGSQLDAVDSGFRLLEAEQALVALQGAALTNRIRLVDALGGGFDPNAAQVAASHTDPRS